MNASGIWSFVIWLAVVLGFVSWRMRIWPWQLLTLERQKIRGDRPGPKKPEVSLVFHYCSASHCLHNVSLRDYEDGNFTAESYWMEHWYNEHGSSYTGDPYIEVVLKGEENDRLG